jgi:hypothetical protein
MTNSGADPAQEEQLRRKLLEETTRLRTSKYLSVSDEAWRRERLFRYLYWREHRAHAQTNLVGSWTLPDLQAEKARWIDYAQRNLSDEQVLDALMAEYEGLYGKTWAEALVEGTTPLLASVHMPVWHEATGSLLPNALGSMIISNAERHDNADFGWSFYYSEPAVAHHLSIVIYDAGLNDLAEGVEDPRLKEEFVKSTREIAQVAAANGETLLPETTQGPVLERLTDVHGTEVEFVGLCVDVDVGEEDRRREAISMRIFRKHFMKVRYSVSFKGDPDELDLSCLEGINTDIAGYVAFFQ